MSHITSKTVTCHHIFHCCLTSNRSRDMPLSSCSVPISYACFLQFMNYHQKTRTMFEKFYTAGCHLNTLKNLCIFPRCITYIIAGHDGVSLSLQTQHCQRCCYYSSVENRDTHKTHINHGDLTDFLSIRMERNTSYTLYFMCGTDFAG